MYYDDVIRRSRAYFKKENNVFAELRIKTGKVEYKRENMIICWEPDQAKVLVLAGFN